MSTVNQQTLVKSGSSDRPLILEKGSYVPWASRFMRFLDNKKEKGKLMRHSIDIRVKNYILQGIPNDIYNSVDACPDVKQMWTRIKRLMQEYVRPQEISINTKFLNSLQPEWSKYVTMTRQKYALKTAEYDQLYDHLSQFEPHVNASKANKAARNHDPLALVANSHAHSLNSYASSSFSRSPQPYYVTHPLSVIDNDDDYQGEIQGDAQEDKLIIAMMLLARAIIQRYSTPTNNRNGNKNVGRQNKNQVTNAGNGFVQSIEENDHNVQRHPRTKEQMLLALKDKARAHLDDEENDFMLDNAYGDNTLEELNAAVIMMAHIQPTDDKSDAKPTYDAEFISEVNASQVDMINGLLSKSDHEQRHHVKLKNIIHTSANDQIVSDIIFDDLYVENNSG
ncbi:hypothetical protein Tco_1185776 [Tanacetum coccineum]